MSRRNSVSVAGQNKSRTGMSGLLGVQVSSNVCMTGNEARIPDILSMKKVPNIVASWPICKHSGRDLSGRRWRI